MTATVDGLVERAYELKAELLNFAHTGRAGRELTEALVERFGDPITTDEPTLANFLDSFVLQHRLGDGRTVLERFVRARGDLSRADRDFLLSWKDLVEGFFAAEALDGDVLVASNVIDDLTYRIRSNMGGQPFRERTPPGSIFIARVVPVLDEWLISGSIAVPDPKHEDDVLAAAVSMAHENPRLLFRNPERLRIGWEMQQADRAQFIEFFGADCVTLPGRKLKARWAEYWQFQHGVDGIDPVTLDDLGEAETVGLIYDEREGLGFFGGFGALQEVFQRPELATVPEHAQVVLRYLRDDSMSPVPLRRCAAMYPTGTDVVFAHLLRRKQFSWQRHGESLLRQYKADLLDREPLPGFLPFGPRLVDFMQRTKSSKGTAHR
jgi:hypothetical protein